LPRSPAGSRRVGETACLVSLATLGEKAQATLRHQEQMRVLIVDDEPMTRDGLRIALSTGEGVEVVEASSGEEALEAAPKLRPDLVLAEVRLPGMNGIELTGALRELVPDAKVIVFARDESRASVSAAMQAGVSGYLLKDSSGQEVLEAARLVTEGKAVLHPKITRDFIEAAQMAGRDGDTASLSRREAEILQKVANGATTTVVAEELGISPFTVKTHLERIFEKLGVSSRAEAVATAMRRDLIE